MEKTSAFPFIPQRPPFVLIDNIIDCQSMIIRTDFTIPVGHVLVEEGHLSEAGLLENIAQTCAARIGWLNKDKPVRLGVIGSISHFEAHALPLVGETIETLVSVEAEIFDALVIHAETTLHHETIAHCDMKVFILN